MGLIVRRNRMEMVGYCRLFLQLSLLIDEYFVAFVSSKNDFPLRQLLALSVHSLATRTMKLVQLSKNSPIVRKDRMLDIRSCIERKIWVVPIWQALAKDLCDIFSQRGMTPHNP